MGAIKKLGQLSYGNKETLKTFEDFNKQKSKLYGIYGDLMG
jgi:hypothetical protein